MIDKELKIILLKRDTFKYLEDGFFSKEELSQILKLLVNWNKIHEIQGIYANDNMYLIPIPNRYYLASETIEFLNQSESLYTYNDQKYNEMGTSNNRGYASLEIKKRFNWRQLF